ncbi:MAG: HD domain-containing phosphohydrolase [Vicinamibacterales bacterium]
MHEALELSICGTGRRYSLTDGARLTVGRVRECEIHLEDQAVSRRHCAIEARGNDLLVTDLDSVNGTFVNERLVRTSSLRPGDRIRVGSTEMEIGGSAPASHGLDPLLTAEDSTMASVIRKRFEPARFDWLTTISGAIDTSTDLGLLQRAQRHLTMLHRVSGVLASARGMPELADAILGAILEVTGGDRAAIVVRRRDPEADGVEVAAARGRVPSLDRFTVSRTLVSDVIDKGVSTFASDAINDQRFSSGASVVVQRVRSVMCVPLRTTDDILGALYVDSLSAAGQFTEADLELLAALGNQAGVALHRVRLMGELERMLIDTIRAIAATIDAKDGYTHRHSERVAALSRRIALELGLSADEQQTAQIAALLHDVGKIAVPDSILNKPGRLTPEEFEEMKKHPAHGARILSNIQSPSVTAVLPGVKYHHERWDGSGYPEGLRGEGIPLLGRLLGIADFFDALTSARAYRPAMPTARAIELIEKESGAHFDPRVVEAVLRLHERGELLPSNWEQLLPGSPGLAASESATSPK